MSRKMALKRFHVVASIRSRRHLATGRYVGEDERFPGLTSFSSIILCVSAISVSRLKTCTIIKQSIALQAIDLATYILLIINDTKKATK